MSKNNSLSRIVATRKVYNGLPTIFVNDKPIHAISTGFHFRRLDIPCSMSKTNPDVIMMVDMPEMSDVIETPNLIAVERHFDRYFNKYREVLGSCLMSLRPTIDWVREHPEEMTRYNVPVDWEELHELGRPLEPSWASHIWRKDSAEFMGKIAKHLHNVFNGRVMAYQIAGGTGENSPVIDPLIYQFGYTGDFSKPMVALFRKKLEKFYKGDVDKLRRTWSQPGVTFKNAMPPDNVERMSEEWFALRSPFRCQTADYYRVWSECIEDCAIGWCKAVKQATNNESLTITPMASVLDTGLNSFFIRHLSKNSYSKCAASPYVDMLQSPASYAYRDPGQGDSSSMIPMGSLLLAGKIWYRDLDTRTSVVKTQCDAHPVGSLWRTPATPWQDVQILKRDAADSLINGGSWRWHEINEGMYKLPEHIRVAKRISAVARGTVYANRARVPSGLGVFVDSNSNFHMANSNRVIFPMNYESRLLHWRHAGMSCDIYDLPDARNCKIPSPKVIMVTNAFCMTMAQGNSIIEMAKRNSAVVLWMMAPGVHTSAGFNLRQSSRITGFKICSADIQALPRITIIPNEEPLTRLQTPDGDSFTYFGAGPHDIDDSGARGIGPIFYADVSRDTDAVVLGVLDALHKPGLVLKKMDGYTSVYCAAPYVPNVLLRAIGKISDAHLYLDTDDLVHVCNNLIMVHAHRPGIKKISWHRKAQKVIDLFSGKEVAHNCRNWSIKMKHYETRFFFAGTTTAGQRVVEGIKSNVSLYKDACTQNQMK